MTSRNDLKGIRFSAALLLIVNYLAAVQIAALFVLESAVLLLRHSKQSTSFALCTYLVLSLCGGFVRLSFRAVHALYAGQRWGTYIPFAWAAFFFALTYGLVQDLRHLTPGSPDEDVAFLFLPPLAAIGLWWCIYFNLPHVRSFFKKRSEYPTEASTGQ